MDPFWRTSEYRTIIQWQFIVGRISVLTFSVILETIQRCQKKVSGALHHLVVSNTVYEIKIFSPLESYVIIIPLLLIHYYRPHHYSASPLKSCFIIAISIYFSLHLWYQSTTASQPNTKQQGSRPWGWTVFPLIYVEQLQTFCSNDFQLPGTLCMIPTHLAP